MLNAGQRQRATQGRTALDSNGVSADINNVQATVQSVDASRRIINLKLPDGTEIIRTVRPLMKQLDQIQAGNQNKVTLAKKLAGYVLRDGKLPGPGGTEEAIPFIARVQAAMIRRTSNQNRRRNSRAPSLG